MDNIINIYEYKLIILMDNVDNNINISGIGSILGDDDNYGDIDFEAMERAITENDQDIKRGQPKDFIDDFKRELENLQINKPNDFKPKYEPAASRIIIDDDEEEEEIHEDPVLNSMTKEENRQSHINKVMHSIKKTDDNIDFINIDNEIGEIAQLREQIDILMSGLIAEGADLSRVPKLTDSSSIKDMKIVKRILEFKNDKSRYCDIFEELVLSGAYYIADVCNGTNLIFGRRIDLVGWPETVKVKLRRMRYDTSSFVGDVMKGYNIGCGWRIMLELIPSLFLYSRDRKTKNNDNLMTDGEYRDAINTMNDQPTNKQT